MINAGLIHRIRLRRAGREAYAQGISLDQARAIWGQEGGEGWTQAYSEDSESEPGSAERRFWWDSHWGDLEAS